jgi:hypothetical protein
MPTTLPLRPHRLTEWIGLGLIGLYFAAIVAVCGVLVAYGPQLRAATEAHEAAIAEKENAAFCGRLGVGPGTDRYADCAAGLKEIRARYLERSTASSIL